MCVCVICPTLHVASVHCSDLARVERLSNPRFSFPPIRLTQHARRKKKLDKDTGAQLIEKTLEHRQKKQMADMLRQQREEQVRQGRG